MFAPLHPIQPDSRSQVAADSLLARVDAIQTVLAVLERLAPAKRDLPAHGLAERAALAAWLTESSAETGARFECELDALVAGLQTGFAALDQARRRGHPSLAAARLLHRETQQALAELLASAGPAHSAP